MIHGLIGQNLSYQKSFSRDKIRGDIVKSAELMDPATLRQTMITKGDPENFNGTYLVECDVPFKSVAGSPITVNADFKSILMRAQPGQDAQMHLQFNSKPARCVIYRPGFTDNSINPKFLGLVTAMNAGILRFMDYGRINGSTLTDTPVPITAENYGVEGFGGSPEEFLKICLATGCDSWMNFPHMCTDGYVHAIGAMLRDLGITTCYAEWSNEVWNTAASIGKNTAYAKQQGMAFWPSEQNQTRAARQYLAKRSCEIYDILSQYVPDTRLVIAGQAGNHDINKWSADWLAANNKMDKVYGFAISPYWGSSDYVKYQPEGPIDLEYFFNQGYRYGDVLTRKSNGDPITWSAFRNEPGVYVMDRAVGFLQSQKFIDFLALCKQYGKVPMAYEGQGPAISSPKMSKLSAALNSDPRILPAIEAHNKLWFESGGREYMHFPLVSVWDESTYAATDRIEVLGPKAMKLAEISARWPHVKIDPEIFKLRKELAAEKAALDSANQALLALSDQKAVLQGKLDKAKDLGKQIYEQ